MELLEGLDFVIWYNFNENINVKKDFSELIEKIYINKFELHLSK